MKQDFLGLFKSIGGEEFPKDKTKCRSAREIRSSENQPEGRVILLQIAPKTGSAEGVGGETGYIGRTSVLNECAWQF